MIVCERIARVENCPSARAIFPAAFFQDTDQNWIFKIPKSGALDIRGTTLVLRAEDSRLISRLLPRKSAALV